jgi:hypothetical protein
MYDMLIEAIDGFMDGYFGHSYDYLKRQLDLVTEWTSEEINAPGSVEIMDQLDAAIQYRLQVRETCTRLLDVAAVPYPWGQTCAEWDNKRWYFIKSNADFDRDRVIDIFGCINDAELITQPEKNQGPSWSNGPEDYLTAALHLTGFTLEEVLAKIAIMERFARVELGVVPWSEEQQGWRCCCGAIFRR